MILLLLLNLLPFQVEASDNDDSIGDFDLVTAINDPSVILNWFYTDDLIQPYLSIEFNVTVYDPDNTSDELTIMLYYSDTVFYLTNISVEMSFSTENSPHNYTYTHVISGQETSTKIYYYYTIDDGYTLQRKPTNSDEFYDVLWSAPPVTIIRNIPRDSFLPFEISGMDLAIIVLFSMILLTGAIFIMMQKSKKYSGV